MVDPISSSAIGKGAAAGAETGAKQAAKQGPSRFDKVLQRQRSAAEVPPLETRVSAAQRKALESDLRKRLNAARGQNPQAIFKPDLDSARVTLDTLHRKAQAIPPGKALDSLSDHLATLDAQFADADKLLEKAGATAMNPRELLQFQVRMYQLTENLNLLSRVVEQVNSSAKQILQTQV
jgi:hypothetical protein